MNYTVPNLVKRLLIALVVAGVVAAGYLAVTGVAGRQSLQLGSGVFRTEVLTTDADRHKGLSGRDELPKTDALLFVFPRNGTWGIWMKDMNFPIDIVWLDEDKNVIFMKQNADPDSYPEVYTPSKNARYVVELAAGTIKDKNIRIGSPAKFDIKGE